MEARNPLFPDCLDDDAADEAPRHHSDVRPTALSREGAIAEWVSERGSGTRLTADRPTLAPPGLAPLPDLVVFKVRLGPSIDEILYRLSLGDEKGAFLAARELGPHVPRVIAPRVVLAATTLPHLEEYVLSFIDGTANWAEILDSSPFAPVQTLGAMCELVDKGIVSAG